MILLWILIFFLALAALIKGSDWLLTSAERFGISFGFSPFVVGVLIVGIGTSFPELVSSVAATVAGIPEFAAANAVGSNIANILLIVGVSAIFARRLVMTKSLIDLDLPLLAASTVLFLGVVWDGVVTLPESLLLLTAYAAYLLYLLCYHDDGEVHDGESSALAVRREEGVSTEQPGISLRDGIFLALGVAALALGAKYLVDSLIALSSLLNVAPGVIAILAVAIGTSLPELLVSVKAALHKKSEVALGNIFGSNVFNILVVLGVPGLFGTLVVDETTWGIGIPALALASLLFVISGISRRIHVWEGAFFLILYALFVGKVLALF